MTTLDSLLANPPAVRHLLKRLHVQGRLQGLVGEALAAQCIDHHARQAGLAVTDAELQDAVDACRRRQGLLTADAMHAWLAGRDLSLDDFEAGLEEDILAAKLRQHLTAAAVDSHWSAHMPGYERLRVAVLYLPRLGLARELACQVRDDGRELADLAREVRFPLAQVECYRRALSGALADALGPAPVGQLVGPVATPQGFALAVVAERRPAELDRTTRQHIQNELFAAWLTERLREASTPPATARRGGAVASEAAG